MTKETKSKKTKPARITAETIIKNSLLGGYFEKGEILEHNIKDSFMDTVPGTNHRLRMIKNGWVAIKVRDYIYKLVFKSDAEVKGYIENFYEKVDNKWEEISSHQIRHRVRPDLTDGCSFASY